MVMEAVNVPRVEEIRQKLQVIRPGLRFREVMTGMITMGITDPVKGYQNDAAVAVQLHATVTLRNLPGFIKDPNHKGAWRAEGTIPVLGGDFIDTGDGDFHLFRRVILDGKGVREMAYDTTFSIQGKQYRMRGRKYIQPAPPWRVWPATTTLYVQLFPTSGGTGEPVGAGVLRISLSGFARQLLTMRVLGDYGLFDRCGYKLSFYRFFVRSLVNTYIKGRRW
jgi:hypothetical protein